MKKELPNFYLTVWLIESCNFYLAVRLTWYKDGHKMCKIRLNFSAYHSLHFFQCTLLPFPTPFDTIFAAWLAPLVETSFLHHTHAWFSNTYCSPFDKRNVHATAFISDMKTQFQLYSPVSTFQDKIVSWFMEEEKNWWCVCLPGWQSSLQPSFSCLPPGSPCLWKQFYFTPEIFLSRTWS